MKRFIRSIPAVVALGAAVGFAAPAQADVKIKLPGVKLRLGDGGSHPDLSPAQIQRRLYRAGYRRVSGVRYTVVNGDDFYRAYAWRNGRRYQLHVSDENGRVIRHQVVRGRGIHRGQRYGRDHRLDRRDVRRRLRAYGYRRIRNIQFVDRGRRDFYRATAWKYGHKYRVRVSDETGRLIASRRIR